ncbi:ricin-type beta-trefoil lectin domain protein [Kitasatospora sp. NPDC004240]
MRRISGLLTLGLLVQTGVALDALTAAPAAAAPVPFSAPSGNEAPDQASALLSARLQGHRVEVTGARTEYATLWANPNGTLTAEQSAGPIRMKVGDAWVPVDTTLVRTADGKVAPKAHPEGLVFEGGDAGVSVGDGLPGAVAPQPVPAPTATAGASPSATPTVTASTTATAAAPSASPTPTPTATAGALPSPSASPSATAEHASHGTAHALAPVADPAPVQPAPAERELVKAGSGEQQLTFGWLGKLPQPKLEGNRATYVDARPGVDLVLEATRTGFEQFLVVKNPAAVSQAGTLTLPLDTTGLTVARQADGSIHLLDKDSGRPAVRIPAPVMWDAVIDPASGEHLNRAPVAMELRGEGKDAELVFTPDAAFLNDTGRQFPVTIDPVVDLGSTFDTWVQSDYGTDQSSSTELKVGTYNGGGVKARSFLHFPTWDYQGKQVLGATLYLWNFHSYSCAQTEWEVWDTGYASTGTRWNAQPLWGKEWSYSFETRDIDSGDPQQCANGDGSGWTKADITTLARSWAGNGLGTNAMGLKADNESDSNSWKRFDSSEGGHPPFISVTYNSVPPTPASVDVQPSQPGSPTYTNSATPRFLVRADDADGGTVGVNVDLWRGQTFVNGIYRLVPANTYLQVTPQDLGVARLDENVSYGVWARVSDANAASGWVGTTVIADTVAPGAPTVTSASYPNDGLWHGAANQGGSFTFTPAAGTGDLVGYVYTLDGAAPVTVNATSNVSTTITPTTEGRRVLSVQAKDRAGNLSPPVEYVFHVGQAGMSSPVNGTQSAKRVKLSVDAQSQFKRVIYQYRRGPGATEYTVPRTNMTKADNTAVTEDKPRLADLGSHANWNVLDTLGNVGGVVQVRAVLFPEDGSGNGYTTAWNTLTVDRNADGAAATDIGPGSVNLLTGDYSTSVTDASEFGMTLARTSSSRDLARGWQPQGERLTLNQRQIGTDTAGFTAGQAALSRSTARGHDSSTDSLLVVPGGAGTWDSFASLGPEYTLGQGMRPGKTYRLTGWIYVPGATGLDNPLPDYGLRLVGLYKTGAGYGSVPSAKAAYTDGWQQLTVDMVVPKDATEAWFRLYNGNAGGSGKEVFFDDLSLKEIVAPFGPQWAGGPDAGTGSEFRSLSFPQSDLVEIKGNDDSSLTFAKGTDGSFFPEPGAESLTLKAVAAKSGALVNSSGQCLEVPNGVANNGTTLQGAACTGAANQQWSRDDQQRLQLLGKCLDNPGGVSADNTLVQLWDCNAWSNQRWDVLADGQVINQQSGKCLDAYRGATIWTCWAGPNQIWDVQTAGTTYELTDLDGSKTVFARQAGSSIYQVVSESGPEAASTTRYQYDTTDGRSLVKRVIPPVEPGVDDANKCSVDPLPRGCEVMEYEYAKTTTATSTTPGDYVDRIKAVKVWSWNPATSRQEAVEVTRYTYNDRGYIAERWDPRLAQPLKTTYAYDTDGRVTRTGVPGELPWDFDFGKAGSDQEPGRLLKVRRGALTQGTKDQVNGDTATKVVYDVPLTRSADGPYDMSGADVATWAQTDAPTDATAVYGPEDEPGTHTASAATPGKNGYQQAIVHYLNASGNEVNTAAQSVTACDDVTHKPCGDIDTKEYDRYGHVVRTLEATNRAIALNVHPDADRFAAELNLPSDPKARARLLDTRTTYTPNGLDVVDTLGPAYRALLAEQVNGSTTPAKVVTEGEKLPQLGTTATVIVQRDEGNWVSGGWSDNSQVMLRGTKAGDSATFRVSVPESGDYQFTARLTKAGDYGIVKFAIDGTDLAGTFDGYSGTLTAVPWEAGAAVHLEPGDHQLQLTVTGANPSAAAPYFQAGIDQITLTKTTLNPTLPAGTSVVARDHNTNTYDEGKPDGQAYHLVTTQTDGARIDGYAQDAELRVTKTGYGTPLGGTSGWTLKKATAVTTDALGAQLTTSTRYDASGRTEEVRVPGSAQADASTVKSVYYTAGANAANTSCANRPEWAGQLCTSGPGADITGADAARMPTTLPVKQVTRYSRAGKPEEVTETNAGKTRATVAVFDAVGRTVSTEVTGGEGQAVPKSETEYDPATGAAVKTTAGGKSVTTVKDLLGRVISYTDGEGGTTSTEYDRFGKPVKVTDPTGAVTYTYDRAKEPRGMVTSVNDSRAGEFTAKYGPDGQLTEQTYPGDIVRKDTANASDKTVARTYTRTSDNTVIWAQNQEISTQSQVTRNTTTNSSKAYTYDRLGRLVKAEQTTATGDCTTRTYTFDTHYNRTAGTVSGPATDGTCTTTGGTTTTHTYDSADRITDAGYTYDAFGRTAKTQTDTIGYYTNDMVASQETTEARRAWTLDPTGRLSRFHLATSKTNDTWVDGPAKINHYAGAGDSPSWTVENESTNAWTRNTKGPDGDLVATSTNGGEIKLQLTDLFGSVVLITDTALTTPVLLDSDEYGNPATGQSATRYGWLGGKQRSTEALDGVVLMGVRLYNTGTGRFLSTDPVHGGSANAYEYNYADPINRYDLDGRISCKFCGKAWNSIIRPVPRISIKGGLKLAKRKAISGGKFFYRANKEMARTASLVGVNYLMRKTAPWLGYRCSGTRYIAVCSGGWGLHSRGGTTIGSTFFTGNDPSMRTDDVLEHERVHAFQWMRFGILFPFKYFSAGVDACTNIYEQQAGLGKGNYTQCL